MNCKRCNAENPPDAAFCGSCGNVIGDTLPTRLIPRAVEHTEGNLPPNTQVPEAPAQVASGYLQVENTSGEGHRAILPEDSGRWTFAGCVPFGIFAFAHNLPGWGTLGCLGSLIAVPLPVYFFVIGASGRQMAWKHRRYRDLEQYNRSMQAWNLAGILIFIVSVLFWIFIGFDEMMNPGRTTP